MCAFQNGIPPANLLRTLRPENGMRGRELKTGSATKMRRALDMRNFERDFDFW